MASTPVLLSVLACSALLSATDESAFQQFLAKFKQSYKGAEYGRRLGIFTSNLKRIDELKKAGATGIGINVFAASTLEEMLRRVIPLDFEKTRPEENEDLVPPARRNKRQTIPSSFDYRAQNWVSPVRDQGQCGSCWAFATVALEECTHMRAYGFTHDLSEQILVDCTPAPNYGCGGGWVNVALNYIRNNNGMTYESYYPYSAAQTSCHSTPTQFVGWVRYFYITSEADIAYYVYNYGAVAFYFQVRAKFLEQHANQPEYRYLKRIAAEEKRKKAVQRKEVSVSEAQKLVQELEESSANATVEAGSILKENEPLLPFLYQGDILLTEEDAVHLNFTKSLKQNRAGGFHTDESGLRRLGPVIKWPHNTPICYTFNQGSDAYTKEVARQAFRFLTENSCLAWQEDCAFQPVVTISTNTEGCFTTVGRAGQAKQTMSLNAAGCAYFATAAHEASHVMGMWHEQARQDRDSYIDIQWNNVAPWKAQYNKADSAQTYGIPYDYGSNMHYGGKAFSQTIDMVATEKMYQHTMGNKYGPIFNDLKFINTYNDCMCKGGISCQNGGFPHPRQCTSKCICPEGFGGATCAERPAGCGAIVQATGTWQTLQVSVPAPSAGRTTVRQSCCTWWIKGNGRKLHIQLNRVTSNDCTGDCMFGGTEIKFGDLTRGGARVCCGSHVKEFGAVFTAQDMAIVRVCSMRSAQEADIYFKTM